MPCCPSYTCLKLLFPVYSYLVTGWQTGAGLPALKPPNLISLNWGWGSWGSWRVSKGSLWEQLSRVFTWMAISAKLAVNLFWNISMAPLIKCYHEVLVPSLCLCLSLLWCHLRGQNMPAVFLGSARAPGWSEWVHIWNMASPWHTANISINAICILSGYFPNIHQSAAQLQMLSRWGQNIKPSPGGSDA